MTVLLAGDDRGGKEKGGRQLRGLLCNVSLGKAGSPYITVGSLASYILRCKLEIYPVFVNTVRCHAPRSHFQGTKVVSSSGEEDADGDDDQEEAGEEEEKAEGLAEASQAASLPLFPPQQPRCDPFHHQVRADSRSQNLLLAAVPGRSCRAKACLELAWIEGAVVSVPHVRLSLSTSFRQWRVAFVVELRVSGFG